jgi:hypothetical protein
VALEQVKVVPPFKVVVNGQELVVDHRSFTLAERRSSRKALAELTQADGLIPDETDVLAALVWVVLHRASPELTLADVFESMPVGDLLDGEELDGEATEDASDPEA